MLVVLGFSLPRLLFCEHLAVLVTTRFLLSTVSLDKLSPNQECLPLSAASEAVEHQDPF